MPALDASKSTVDTAPPDPTATGSFTSGREIVDAARAAPRAEVVAALDGAAASRVPAVTATAVVRIVRRFRQEDIPAPSRSTAAVGDPWGTVLAPTRAKREIVGAVAPVARVCVDGDPRQDGRSVAACPSPASEPKSNRTVTNDAQRRHQGERRTGWTSRRRARVIGRSVGGCPHSYVRPALQSERSSCGRPP